jgi:aspartate aminotransferase
MPSVSNRAKNVFTSPFRKYNVFADEAKKNGIKVVHLNIGQPDFAMPEGCLQKMVDDKITYIPYGRAAGDPELCSIWADYYKKFEIDVNPDQLIITTGASEALLFTLLAVMDVGEQVIIPEPFYANYNGFCQMAGIDIVPLSSSIEDGFPIPHPAEFRKAISARTRAILLSNPNNPSGKVYSRDMLEELLRMAIEHDMFLIVDEAYSEFLYEGFSFYSALRLRGAEKHVIVVDSVSKRFNACGIRVGAIVSRHEALMESVTRYAKLRLSPPLLGQALSKKLLTSDQSYHEKVLESFEERRSIVLSALEKMDQVVYHAPEGAFYAFVQLPIRDADHFCTWILSSFHHNGYTVMLSPGMGFYATPGKGENQIRIAYIKEPQQLRLAMECLHKALEAYPDRVGNATISSDLASY